MLKKSHCMIAILGMSAGFEVVSQPVNDGGVFRGVLMAGGTVGGEVLAEVEIDDDFFFSNSDDELRAGEGIYLGGGFAYHSGSSPLSLQATVGYHFSSLDASNGDVDFSRTTLDFLAFFQFAPQHRIGLGITHHLEPEFEIDISGGIDETIVFDDATGVILEYGWSFTDFATLGVRFVAIDYEIGNVESLNGNHVGLMFGFEF